jgi:phosphatidylinositol-bisphosphatase
MRFRLLHFCILLPLTPSFAFGNQLGMRYLVGILLLVYVRREQQRFITDLEFDSVGVGLLGVAGNKGGVAIRFQYHDTSVCVVNSHLAASQNNVLGR